MTHAEGTGAWSRCGNLGEVGSTTEKHAGPKTGTGAA